MSRRWGWVAGGGIVVASYPCGLVTWAAVSLGGQVHYSLLPQLVHPVSPGSGLGGLITMLWARPACVLVFCVITTAPAKDFLPCL